MRESASSLEMPATPVGLKAATVLERRAFAQTKGELMSPKVCGEQGGAVRVDIEARWNRINRKGNRAK